MGSRRDVRIDLLVSRARNPVSGANATCCDHLLCLMLGCDHDDLERAGRGDGEVPRQPRHITVAIIHLVMKVARSGLLPDLQRDGAFGFHLLISLLQYVLTVVSGLAVFQFLGYSLILIVSPRFPGEFFRKIRIVMITPSPRPPARTLPTTLQTSEENLGSQGDRGFVLPLAPR